MIIRSQDKKQIVNFDVCHLSITTDHCIVATNGLVSYPSEILSGVIGRYSTEEKAIKVLDMIQEVYGKHLYGQGGQMATANYYVPPFAFIPPKVFQMPLDEEVEV